MQEISITRIIATILIFVTCMYASTSQISGVDFWLQVKVGEIISRSHEIPSTLLFPFTEIVSEKFNAHEWLSSLFFYSLIQRLGESFLPFFLGLLGLVIFSLGFYFCYIRSRGNILLSIIGATLVIAGENYRHVLRPELLSLIAFSTYWIFLDKFQNNPRATYLIYSSTILIIWTNIHGSFVLGPILAIIYAVGEHVDAAIASQKLRIRPNANTKALFLFAICAILACLINPFGIQIYHFVLTFGNNQDLSLYITEWMPTLSMRWRSQPAFWMGAFIWALCLFIVMTKRSTLKSKDIFIFIFISILAFKAFRFLVYLGFLAAFLISSRQKPTSDNKKINAKTLWLLIIAYSLILAALARNGNLSGSTPSSYGTYRFGPDLNAALSSKKHSGNVLTTLVTGCELVYIAYPRLKPSIDCRVDSYGMDYFKYQASLIHSPLMLREFIERYNVRYILIDNEDLELAEKSGKWNPEKWIPIANDKNFSFLMRSDDY